MADKIIKLSDGTDNLYPQNKNSGWIGLTANTSTSVSNLSKYSHGILYAFTTLGGSARAISAPFNVASIGTPHCLYCNSSSYLYFTGNLTNNTITTSGVTGMSSIGVVLYT